MDIQNVVVTGASSGVGEAVARRLARRGMKVYGVALAGRELRSVARTGNFVPVACDVTKPDQVREAFEDIERNGGPIHVLVNNAAAFQMRDFWTQDVGAIDRMVDTNLKGTMYCTRLVLPYMIARKAGRILNVASVAGTHGIPRQAVYCGSKHGVVGFADALAQELRPLGIQVTTICPGGIDTPLWRGGENPYPGDLDKTMKPDELADLVEFLLSRPDGTLYKKLVFFPMNEWH